MKSKIIWSLAALAAVAVVLKWVIAATAFDASLQPTGSIAQLEATNYKLTSGNEIIFKTDYEKQNWTGNVFAYPVSATGVLDTPGEVWGGGASAHLDAQDWDVGRIIVTMKDNGSKIPFRYAQLSTAQQTAVGGQTSLDFVRGDRSNEGVSGYRVRNSVLGDILHSRPYYLDNSGAPVLFVGANDGMLHAFDGSRAGGAELWAYVPSMLLGNLPALHADPYVHTYFIDGGLNIGDAVISGVTKKVLVSGLGAGGAGLFAIDVTDPRPTDEAAAAANILWEITPSKINNASSTSYSNLGMVYGTPVIVKVNSGSGQSAVIVGNGYNASGVSTLYVINIADGSRIASIATSGAASGGLSTPACYDATGDGRIDYCYAGDIDGKLWKFDLSSASSASWSASLVYTTNPAQAITMAPSISTHPNGGVMVNFGTGRMFNDADVADTSTFYAYGIWDRPPAYAANAVLLTQTLSNPPKTYVNGAITTKVRVITTNNVPDWTAGATHNMGWRVALPAGERIIGDTVFTESGRFYFNAYNPTVINTSPTPNGENWLMELDYLTGGANNSPFLDLNGDQLLTDADRIKYTAADVLPAGKSIGDPISTLDGIPVGKFITNGVSSHPILVQLATLNTTLLNQNPDVVIPGTLADRGVAGGHFDVDIFYGPQPTPVCSYTGGSTGFATGSIDFTYSSSKTYTNLSITLAGGANILTSTSPGSQSKSGLETWISTHINAATLADYNVAVSGSQVVFTAKATGSAYNKAIAVTATGMVSGDRTVTSIAGGGTPSLGTFSSCSMKKHFHEYDDIFNVTGVNMLNASSTTLNLENAISDANAATTQFKVLVHNQYLSPAVTLSVGGAAHTSVKTYNNLASETVAANVLANAPTYTRNTVGTLEWNMPLDAFQAKDWWGSGDTRAGLHPTNASCVMTATTATGVLFRSVVPPANGVNGPGVNQTSPTATGGVRHNGALTIQLIKASTPASSIEMQVAGRPEYGWRLKQADFETYAIADWATYWHHPNGKCYGDTGWTKMPPQDFSPSDPSVWQTPAAGSADPNVGSFRATSNIVSVVTTTTVRTETVAGVAVQLKTTVQVTTYADGTTKTVTRTQNADGTTTIVTVTPDGKTTTETVANTAGGTGTGGDEKGSQAKTGRVSWSELLRQ